MPGSIKDAKKNLAAAIVEIKQAKMVIGAIVQAGRLLPLEDEIHQLQDMALILGADVQTIESNLSSFGRMTVGSERFCVKK